MNKYTQGNITVYANSWEEALIMINEIRNIEKDCLYFPPSLKLTEKS